MHKVEFTFDSESFEKLKALAGYWARTTDDQAKILVLEGLGLRPPAPKMPVQKKTTTKESSDAETNGSTHPTPSAQKV